MGPCSSEFDTIRSGSNFSRSFIRGHLKQGVKNRNLLEFIVPYARVDVKVEEEERKGVFGISILKYEYCNEPILVVDCIIGFFNERVIFQPSQNLWP